MQKIIFFLTILIHFTVPSAYAVTVSGEEAVKTLEFIECQMDQVYAPALWKELHHEWSQKEKIENLKAYFASHDEIDLKEAQLKIQQFIHGLKDYHTNIFFYSTESAKLPFTVKGAEGKYFITSVDLDQVTEEHHPISVGDELLSLDGRKIEKIVQELKKNLNFNTHELTDQSMCEIFLSSRAAYALASPIPRGVVYLKLKSKEDGHLYGLELAWEYEPEKVTCGSVYDKFPKKRRSKLLNKKALRKEMMHAPFAVSEERGNKRRRKNVIGVDPNAQGTKKSHLPHFGKLLWETNETYPFHAYIFLSPENKKVGYLRIPSYSVRSEKECLSALEALVDLFERQTEMLIIDQLNNPGGSAFYLYGISSFFTDVPLQTPLHRKSISYSDVYQAVYELSFLDWITSNEQAVRLFGDSICGLPVSFQFVQYVKNYQRFILNESKLGKTISEPFHIWGVNAINPQSKTRYTKKILMLINELDFSCGDFFPAIFQDNGRATLFGCRTAGAGGAVEYFDFPNSLGIASIALTTTIAERSSTKRPIEDLGVSPDIEYVVTAEDIQNGYQGYKRAVLKTIGDMMR